MQEHPLIINGNGFTPLPKVNYRYDYIDLAQQINAAAKEHGLSDADKAQLELQEYRKIFLTDLWFIVYFILGIKAANDPFVINQCQVVEQGPKDFTLDVWAREHFKSSIMTIAETLQEIGADRDKTTGIISATRPLAKDFLNTLKMTMEKEAPFLHGMFCEYDNNGRLVKSTFWADPQREAPVWSLDGGLFVDRETKRPEPTVGAYGLVEGLPTGKHHDRLILDDIVTEDHADSPEVMQKIKRKFDSAQNVGKRGGTRRVIGTFYHHNDPLVDIRDKKHAVTQERLYKLRLVPATDDGTKTGKPIFLTQSELDMKKNDRTFNCQQLCNPTPTDEQKIPFDALIKIEADKIPSKLVKFEIVDPAGGSKDSKRGDSWAIGVFGVDPNPDEMGQHDVYILDLFIDKIGEAEGPGIATDMFLRNGYISMMCVEKVSQSTTEVHITTALKKKGRHISEKAKNLHILRPAGRNKERRILDAISRPLLMGKIKYSDAIAKAFIDRIEFEMDDFPFAAHDDGIDMISYLWDVLADRHVKALLKSAAVKPKSKSSNAVPYHGEGSTQWLLN
jgi:hypothetical protein